jgi:hypothetical protein
MKPDVIVNGNGQTVLFKTQNKRVSEWLREHYHMTTENPNGHTEFRVHPTRCKRIVEELKAAGFNVFNL